MKAVNDQKVALFWRFFLSEMCPNLHRLSKLLAFSYKYILKNPFMKYFRPKTSKQAIKDICVVLEGKNFKKNQFQDGARFLLTGARFLLTEDHTPKPYLFSCKMFI